MKLFLTKDWAGFKKGSEVDINDNTVIEKGLEIGLFNKEVKKAKSK